MPRKKQPTDLDALFSQEASPFLAPDKYINYRAELIYKDGIPQLASAPIRISDAPQTAIMALLKKTLDLPYEGRDPSLQGLSMGEAMVINMARQAAYGDRDARVEIMDRLLGRPQQNIKAVNLTGDLNDFLDNLAKSEKIVDVEITPEPSTPDNSVEDL